MLKFFKACILNENRFQEEYFKFLEKYGERMKNINENNKLIGDIKLLSKAYHIIRYQQCGFYEGINFLGYNLQIK